MSPTTATAFPSGPWDRVKPSTSTGMRRPSLWRKSVSKGHSVGCSCILRRRRARGRAASGRPSLGVRVADQAQERLVDRQHLAPAGLTERDRHGRESKRRSRSCSVRNSRLWSSVTSRKSGPGAARAFRLDHRRDGFRRGRPRGPTARDAVPEVPLLGSLELKEREQLARGQRRARRRRSPVRAGLSGAAPSSSSSRRAVVFGMMPSAVLTTTPSATESRTVSKRARSRRSTRSRSVGTRLASVRRGCRGSRSRPRAARRSGPPSTRPGR